MLSGIHIVDFGNHRNTRLTFGRMTALVGTNGSGKSTAMKAIGEIGRAAASGSRSSGRPFLRSGQIELSDDSTPFKSRYFKASSQLSRLPALAEDETPIVNGDGSNLAGVLAYLMTAEPHRFARIVEALREIVPIVKRVRSHPVRLTRLEKHTDEQREVMGHELIFDMISGNGLPAFAVGEGTLAALAILTLVYGSEDVDVLMLDDVEVELHPKAQRDLLKQLRGRQNERSTLQIIVSTHSPYVVDEFKPEDVWLFSTNSEGCAVSKRLNEHPGAKRAMEVLTTGEFWSAESEDWMTYQEISTTIPK